MLMLVDHVLHTEPFYLDVWKFMGSAWEPGTCGWYIFRRYDGYWAKGRPAGDMFHAQSIGQIWDLYIQSGVQPPAELFTDTQVDKEKQRKAEVKPTAPVCGEATLPPAPAPKRKHTKK